MLRLTEKRREKGLTIPQLAKLTGINSITIREAEMRGDCKLSIVQKIADALEIPIEELWDPSEDDSDNIFVYETDEHGPVAAQLVEDAAGVGSSRLAASGKRKSDLREVITVYRILNYRGVEKMFSLEPLKSTGSRIIPELYYLPKGYTAIYDSGVCKAIKTNTGEIAKFFIARGDTPVLSLADNNMAFLEPVE